MAGPLQVQDNIASLGVITALSGISTFNGNITTTNGDLVATNGSVNAPNGNGSFNAVQTGGTTRITSAGVLQEIEEIDNKSGNWLQIQATGNVPVDLITGGANVQVDTNSGFGLQVTTGRYSAGSGNNTNIFGGASGSSIVFITGSGIDMSGGVTMDLQNISTSHAVCYSGAQSAGAVTNRDIGTCDGTPNDYAEFYPTETDVSAGDLVATTPNMLTYQAKGADPETGITESLGTKQISILKKATVGDSAIGIVSTAPYQTIGADIPTSAHRLPIALNGRVPLKVNNEGGVIHAGDQLTLSSVPGVATKATIAGKTFAVALSDFTGTSGTIMVYVQTGYYNPADSGSIQGSTMQITGDATIGGDLNVAGEAKVGSLHVTGDVTVGGTLHAQAAEFDGVLTAAGHIVSKGNAPTITVGAAIGTGNGIDQTTNPTVQIAGTDNAGSVTITTGSTGDADGVLAHLVFAKAYDAGTAYNAVISATNGNATDLRVYIVKTDGGFDIVSKDAPTASQTYTFDYIVLGSQQVASN
jgi:hypothetical protein